jgi:class 3 adenylate cyclase
MLDSIAAFLGGDARHREPEGVLATVMCVQINEPRDEAVTRSIQRFRGREITTSADSLLVVFDGPARAVACARAIREATTERGLVAQIGVHIGAIDANRIDPNGVAFKIVTQVAAIAAPNEVLLSRTVLDVSVGSGIETIDRGDHVLDGAPGTWQLFAVKE